MNGGVIFESNTQPQLPSAPVLKQELITEHYAITAKRPSHKDKMNRPPKINTTVFPIEPPHQAATSYTPGQPSGYPGYPPNSAPPAFYPPPPGQYYVYPPGPGPMPGPSRRPSQPTAYSPVPQHMMYAPHGVPYDASPPYGASPPYSSHPPLAQAWDNASVVSSASVSSSQHKRKRSNSSQREELRTPRKTSAPLLPESTDSRGNKRQFTGGSQLPTPPATGDNFSTPIAPSQPLPDDKPLSTVDEHPHGVYVTTTEEEGRKLGLVQNSNGSEAVEDVPTRGPPRTTTAAVLSVNSSGVASVGSADVLRSDLPYLENVTSTPGGGGRPQTPRTPPSDTRILPDDHDDTPRTKEGKIKRRLEAFNGSDCRPSEPMFSIRIDMGQGEPSRVALRKDIALAFIGFDKATKVVVETRGVDQDGWATLADGQPGSKPVVRPDWPDEEAPWKIGGGSRRARQLREDKEREALLRHYLEASSDDEDDDDGAARFPNPKGKNALRRRLNVPANKPAPPATGGWENNPSDARAALLSTLYKGRQRQTGTALAPTVACACKQSGSSAGQMITCSSCKTWHHLACVGIDDVNLAPNWVCDACVAQARRATTLATPTSRSASFLNAHERSSAFRGDTALALAPSPMFAGEAARAASSGGGGGGGRPAVETHTPQTPSHNRARVLSYGYSSDLWGVNANDEVPSTPIASARLPDRFSTPRVDDPVFDVNSTPSRHLNTDPRMAGQFNSLFSMTPLMGKSRNVSNLLVGDTPVPLGRGGGGRNTSGIAPFSDSVTGRHEFLQGLTNDRRAPYTEGPVSPSVRRGAGLLGAHQLSPSPYGSVGLGHRRTMSGNKFSHLRSGSRSGLGLGMPIDEDDADAREAESAV